MQRARYCLEEFLKAGVQISSSILHGWVFSIIFIISLSLEYVVGFTLDMACEEVLDF